MNVRLAQRTDSAAWDRYVLNHPKSTHCHLSRWKDVIQRTYGHTGYYLMAEEASRTVGILPLVFIRSVIFGRQLVSMPFLNYGGVLGDTERAEEALLRASVDLCERLRASSIELRHRHPLHAIDQGCSNLFAPHTQRVSMVLDLPDSSEALFKSLKSKLRSQIRRPQKEGLSFAIGGAELLNGFYYVFSVNMRDLGSPVHSMRLFREILSCFGDSAHLGVVRCKDRPIAAGLIICFRETVEIPWASTLRQYNHLSPNMLLYWSFLEYGCRKGYGFFDFGRTTKGKGTYKFKEQWGTRSKPLCWYFHSRSRKYAQLTDSDSNWMIRTTSLWQKLPVQMANLFGPAIRSSIPL